MVINSLAAFLAVACMVLAAMLLRQKAATRTEARYSKEYREAYRVRQNLLRCHEGVYQLFTMDGKNWTEFKLLSNDEYELVDPSVIQQLDANVALARDVARNGPVSLGDAERVKLLGRAGLRALGRD